MQSVTSAHVLLYRLPIRADSLVFILQPTQHLLKGTDTYVVSCRQFETHVQSVSSLGTTYTIICCNYYSIADKVPYCAFYDRSITFLPLVEHILRVILLCGGKLDLSSDDL